ncbi:MAG: flagellar biosynthetic protein FliO [Anaeromyxobacter sp.]
MRLRSLSVAAALLLVPVAGAARADQPAQSGGVHFPAEIPLRRDPEGPVGAGRGTLGWLVIAGVLAVALAVVLRQRSRGSAGKGGAAGLPMAWLGGGGRSDRLRVLRSARLTPRASVHVVSWEGKELLLGATDGSITVLGQRDGAEPEPGKAEPAEARP